MKPISYTMTTANCVDGELRHGHEVQLEIESLEEDAKFRLENVLTTSNLPISERQMATNEDIKSESMGAPGRCATCHLSDFAETWPA